MRQLAYGEPLVLENVPEPVPGPGEVVITITRAAVNPLDVWISAGTVATSGPLPRTGGSEGAGVTEDGRRVAFRGAGIGVVRDGSYAERIAVPASALADVPDAVTDAQAAGVGIAGVTAHDIVELAGIEAGMTVLVLGASGGVGSYTVQIARARGARVIAQTSREESVARLLELADDVVVSDGPDLASRLDGRGGTIDVVFDPLGGPYAQPAAKAMGRGGVMVVFGASAGRSFSIASADFYRKSARIIGYGGLGSNTAELSAKSAHLLQLLASGQLAPVATTELPLEEVNEAHARIVERRAGGKLLLIP
ncbi:MAG: NADPH:quinone reductase [Gaiellaceae bacterium]|nr:NADPH:quinone reductase [Gaiellaceae bacterium]